MVFSSPLLTSVVLQYQLRVGKVVYFVTIVVAHVSTGDATSVLRADTEAEPPNQP